MPWEIRIKFRMKHNFNSDLEFIELFKLSDDINIILIPWFGTLKEGDEYIIKSGHFLTMDDACEFADKIYNSLLVLSVERDIPVDFLDNSLGAMLSDCITKQLRDEHNVAIRRDVNGLDIYDAPIETTHIGVKAMGHVQNDPGQFTNAFNDALQNRKLLNPKIRLAIALHNDAKLALSTDSAFVTHITAIEILSPILKSETKMVEAITIIKEFVKSNDKIDTSYRDIILNKIGSWKTRSKSDQCRSHISEIIGNDVAERFSELYRIRGVLVHDGKSRGIDRSLVNEVSNIAKDLILFEINKNK